MSKLQTSVGLQQLLGGEGGGNDTRTRYCNTSVQHLSSAAPIPPELEQRWTDVMFEVDTESSHEPDKHGRTHLEHVDNLTSKVITRTPPGRHKTLNQC